MSGIGAWLSLVTHERPVSFGIRELLHIVHQPLVHPVPRAPKHCRSVLLWEGNVLPVVDLAVLLEGVEPRDSYRFVGILGYYAPGKTSVSVGGIALDEPPTKLELSDLKSCDLPEELRHWRPYVNACFGHERAVPVVHVPSLFKPLREEPGSRA